MMKILPPYLSIDWLRTHGVDDPIGLLAAMRPEADIMRPEALRATKATRLSFTRSLVLRMERHRWRIELRESKLDMNGAGCLIYDIEAEGHVLQFVVASIYNGETDRSGRFSETTFDFLGSILDGPIDKQRAELEAKEMVEKVWAGRTNNDSLGWTVANRSNRFFDYVVERLVQNLQPDPQLLASGGGYIIRNAGWYGNGRHGSRAWHAIPAGHPLSYPYHIDIFALYLWRQVGFDVAEAVARLRSPTAASLDPAIKRTLGIGNASGIGMVAALVRWPAWLSAFNFLRELALAYAKLRYVAFSEDAVSRLEVTLLRMAAYYDLQPGCPVPEIIEPVSLAANLRKIAEALKNKHLIAELIDLAAALGRETQEQFNAALIEQQPEFTDEVATLLPTALSVSRRLDPNMSVQELRKIICQRYDWALDIDIDKPGAREYFWYRSEENGENRRGERAVDPGVENETFVDVAGTVHLLLRRMENVASTMSVGEFLLLHPDLPHVVSRVQLAAQLPYSEIRGNIIDRNFLPMDGIRFLLSTMGLESSHPHNTRWVRGVFLQDAPLIQDLSMGKQDARALADIPVSVARGDCLQKVVTPQLMMHISVPELQRQATDVLRGLGGSIGNADDGVECFVLSQIALGRGYQLLRETDLTSRVGAPVLLQERGMTHIDLQGESLLFLAARLSDFAAAAKTNFSIFVKNFSAPWAMPYLLHRLADRGKVALAQTHGNAAEHLWALALPSNTESTVHLFNSQADWMQALTKLGLIPSSGMDVLNARAKSADLTVVVHDNAGVMPWPTSLENAKAVVFSGARNQAISSGLRVDVDDHKFFQEVARRIRVETSERSKGQAG